MANWTREYANYTSHQRPIVGDTKMSALTTDHIGWLKCDGRALQVADYYFLWRVIGHSFGSNTSNDFFLPNPAGRVPGFIGTGSSPTLTARSLGDKLGAETHTLTIAEMPTHTHGISDPGHTHSYTTAGNTNTGFLAAEDGGDGVFENATGGTTGSNVTGITASNAGGSNAHNNMQPTLFVGSMFIYSGKNNVGTYPQALNANVY
jgi:microcystin-dependent protein